MPDFTQMDFKPEFVENPEPRCPCVLLLDTSGSMKGDPIRELSVGIEQLRAELAADDMASKRVEIAMITFGGPPTLVLDFVTPEDFVPPVLTAVGDTPLGGAIRLAIDLVTVRKDVYRANGVAYYRPWIFLISDGEPTDSCVEAQRLIAEGEAARHFLFFAVGVQRADFDLLGELSVRTPLKLEGLQFRELFTWLSNSLRLVSRSRPGDVLPFLPKGGPGELG